ncbi:MAG: tetratricopeptide repeat protein, partial [Pirellulaceae bacterium]
NKNADAEKAYLEALNLAPNDWEINADYLLLLENSHRLPNEVRDLRSKLSANPNDPLLHRLLGDLLRQSNDPIGAEGAYRDAIRLDPQDFFAHTKLGGVLIEQDKPNDSLPVLHEAIHLAPDFPWAHWYLGAALSALEKWTEAEQSLRKAWELSPFNYLGYFMLMTSVRNQNKSTTDVPRPFLPATSAPFSYPGGAGPTASFKGQFELGAVMHTASPFQIADRVLARGRDAASRGRTDTRGTSLTRANQEATLRDAIAKYPKDWAVREKLGAHLLGQRNTKALYTAMWEAICANPTNAKFHAYLGAAFGDSRHYAEAALRESIRLKADDPLAHRLLARALENQGRHSEAVAAAHMAIHLEKDNYENHGMLGWCLARQGDLAGAEAAYREALKRNARSPFIYLDLACVLRRMGKNEEADAQFNEAKKFRVTTTNGTNFFSHANLGHYFARQSQFTNALQHYEAALHENPKDSHSAMRMAFLRHFQGDRGEYERICQQMLEVFKETTNPVDARRTVHVCLITPQIVGDLATHTKLEEHFRDQKTISSALLVLRERALLAYRRGAWDEALRLARASRAEVDKTRAVAQSANEEDSGGTEKQLRLSQAQNLVVEAMALHRQGQTAAARQAYSMAGRLNTASYPLAPEALDGAWVDWIIYELLRREARQLFCIDDSIDWRELVARGRAAAAKGDWKTAAAEFNRACESPAADSFYWLGAATATVRAGDTDLYRRHCLAMIEQFNGTGNWNDIERTLKNCALAKNDVQVPRKMLDFVSKGLDDGSAPRGLVAWANVGRALLAFRKADWDNAVRWADSAAADEVNSLQSQALALVTSALANHGKGDLERAKARLKEAITVHEQIPVPHLPDGSVDERLLLLENNGWVDWMNVSLLRQEAVALIGDVAPDRTLATATAPTGPSANPLLSDEAVNAARRIKGSVASWSPDGKKIVRNLNSSDMQNADLEVVDLITGTTTKLFHGGKDPAWSPLPGGPIACARFGRNGADLADEEIWLVQPDGTSPRKLTNGGFPSWTSDGRLFYRTGATTATWALQVVNPDQPNFQPQSFPGANAYPAVSPDGSLIAFAQRDPPSLVVRNVATSATVASINREQMGTLLASWSPDGRYVGYGDYRPNTEPGLWLLDVKTGRTRLLTTQRLTCPRWSPDGKTIAADDRLKSELVILDVSSLKLENGLPDAGSTESSASK